MALWRATLYGFLTSITRLPAEHGMASSEIRFLAFLVTHCCYWLIDFVIGGLIAIPFLAVPSWFRDDTWFLTLVYPQSCPKLPTKLVLDEIIFLQNPVTTAHFTNPVMPTKSANCYSLTPTISRCAPPSKYLHFVPWGRVTWQDSHSKFCQKCADITVQICPIFFPPSILGPILIPLCNLPPT